MIIVYNPKFQMNCLKTVQTTETNYFSVACLIRGLPKISEVSCKVKILFFEFFFLENVLILCFI